MGERRGHVLGMLAAGLTAVAAAAVVYVVPFPAGNAAPVPWPLLAGTGPGGLVLRVADGAVEVTARSVAHLQDHFARIGYGWERVPGSVPRVRVTRLPDDLAQLREPAAKKRLFVQSVLPLVLLENERVLAERARLRAALAQLDAGDGPAAPELGAGDVAWLIDLKARYGVHGTVWSPRVRRELLARVDAVPPSLAVAMAAYESGWGTSRFCAEGNNLFGQWTFVPGAGIVPLERVEGARHELAVFPDLAASVRAYIHNLNSHWAYEEFRRLRASLDDTDSAAAAGQLARSLVRYSERGAAYTHDVARLIRVNRLTRFDGAALDVPRHDTAQAPDPAVS